MRLRMYQVDAFTSTVFGGNPAAVVPLPEWLDDGTMQSVAQENNLSETAFFVIGEDSHPLRWFTPVQEVPLCGHATLASAFIVFTELDPSARSVRFDASSGTLEVRREEDDLLTMSFPRLLPVRREAPADLLDALDRDPIEVLATEEDSNYYAIFGSEEEVRSASPDLRLLETLHPYGLAISAPGDEADFVSRYFAPSYGIPEDPVTGSIHCALTPFWARRLGERRLRARQLSRRGGDLLCEDGDERVLISGKAVKYMEADIEIGHQGRTTWGGS